MPNFSEEQLFGSFATIDRSQLGAGSLTIYLSNFLYQSSLIPEEVGVEESSTMSPVQILYGILMLLKQSQELKIDDNPSQRVYIAHTGNTLARGRREGQVKSSFTISFFCDTPPVGIPTMWNIDQYSGIELPPIEPPQ
jgi:hypothetical protein